MITLEKIEHEITQTMEEPMSLHSIEKLNALYKAKRNLSVHEAHRGRLSREEAHEWVRRMEHEDGTKGEHWTCEQTTQVMRNKGYGSFCCGLPEKAGNDEAERVKENLSQTFNRI